MKKGKEIGNSESKIPVEKKNVAYYVLSEENIALKWHLSSLQREYIKKKKQQRLYSCFQGLISVYETHYIMWSHGRSDLHSCITGQLSSMVKKKKKREREGMIRKRKGWGWVKEYCHSPTSPSFSYLFFFIYMEQLP